VVIATHPEFADGSTAITVGRDDLEDVVITMRRGAIVAGTVTDSNGAPILGADVSARIGRGTVGLAYTDADGRYELRGLLGEITLRAAARGNAPVEAKVAITIDDDGRTVMRDFRLGSAGAEVAGVVQDGLRRPIAGAQVMAAATGGLSGRAVTDSFGRFTVRGLPDGPVTLQVQHPDYAPASGTSRTGRDNVEITLAPAGGLAGQVRDAHTGGPMLSFTLRARGPAGAEVTRSFEKGDFALVPIVPGRWTVTVEAPGYATRVVAFDVPPAREPRQASLSDVRIELRQGGTLAGIVYDQHGDVVSGALIQVGLVRATSDSRGRFRLVGVEPGDITVRASHPQAGHGETEVALRSGDEILTLELKLAP
jgi:protocatechuate 3,4-dioxygenase beta subunit